MTPIGTTAPDRLTCQTADRHIPGCHNPQPARRWPDAAGVTACICGAHWWPGRVGTWHSSQTRCVVGETTTGRPIYEDGPWDIYFLHTAECERHDANPEYEHLCADVEGAGTDEAWRASA